MNSQCVKTYWINLKSVLSTAAEPITSASTYFGRYMEMFERYFKYRDQKGSKGEIQF